MVSVVDKLRLTVSRTEAAEMLGISPRHFDRLRESGGVPRGIQLGSRIVWGRADLEKWLEEKMAAAQTGVVEG